MRPYDFEWEMLRANFRVGYLPQGPRILETWLPMTLAAIYGALLVSVVVGLVV
jgi:hypothetical protein